MMLHKPFSTGLTRIKSYCGSNSSSRTAGFAFGSSRPNILRSISSARNALPDEGPMGEDLSDIMKQDLERFAQRQPAAAKNAAEQKQQTTSSPVKEAIDKVLIADFFFILLVLAWLGVGLVEKSALQSSNLIDAWMPLWPMVFQPAIGILMAGALVSGGLNWLAEQQQQKS